MNPISLNNLRRQRNIDRNREDRGGSYPDWRQSMASEQVRAIDAEDDEMNRTLQHMRDQQ